MSSDEIHPELDIVQAETLILKESRELGLEKHEGLTLQGVKIAFEKLDPARKQMCDPNIDDEGILHVQLRDVSIVSGVKLYFATLVNAMDSGPYVSPFLAYLIGFLYPISMFTLSLALVISFFISDILLSIVFGPIVFSVFVVPTLFWVTLRNRDQNRKKIDRMKSKLDRISLFTNEHETIEYCERTSGRNIFGPAMSFTMYIILAIFLLLAVIFGFDWAR